MLAERTNQAQKAERRLRTMILNGELEAGGRISELSLSEQLGISRTPIREAVARLIDEGLISPQSSGRNRVANYSEQDIIDAIEMRGTIEGLAARLAAERGVPEVMLSPARAVLDRIDRVLEASGGFDFEEYVSLNAEFHDWLQDAASSPIVKRELTRVARLPLAGPSAFLTSQEVDAAFLRSLHIAQSQHRALLEAISEREGGRAEAVAREHARLARRNLEDALHNRRAAAPNIPGLALVTPD